MKSIERALTAYHFDHNCYPDASDSGGLYRALCTEQAGGGGTVCGPYLTYNPRYIAALPGTTDKALASPLGGFYVYKNLRDADGRTGGYVLIDPGEDQLLGGIIHPAHGFIPTNADRNDDGIPDNRDNIVLDSTKRNNY